MSQSENSSDAEISSLFEDAKTKIDKTDAKAQKDKKQIIIQLARDLEGKIPTDSISLEIVNQLRRRVSERFIHESIDEKYKQKCRVENARKQKNRQQQGQQQGGNENLPALTPLNQEAKSNKIMVGIDGRSVEEENPETYPNIDSSIKPIVDSTFC